MAHVARMYEGGRDGLHGQPLVVRSGLQLKSLLTHKAQQRARGMQDYVPQAVKRERDGQ